MRSSIGSGGEGLAVPQGSVEVVFERKDTPYSATYSPELWWEYVPDYWIGKDALVEVCNRDIHGPNTPKGSFDAFMREDIGTVVGAHPEGIVLSLHPKEHGHLPQDSGCPYTRVGYLKLAEGQ